MTGAVVMLQSPVYISLASLNKGCQVYRLMLFLQLFNTEQCRNKS